MSLRIDKSICLSWIIFNSLQFIFYSRYASDLEPWNYIIRQKAQATEYHTYSYHWSSLNFILPLFNTHSIYFHALFSYTPYCTGSSNIHSPAMLQRSGISASSFWDLITSATYMGHIHIFRFLHKLGTKRSPFYIH